MDRFSIRTKIILATTIVLGMVFAGFSLVVYQRVKSAYMGRLDAKLQGYAGTFREEVEEQESEHLFPSARDFKALTLETLTGAWVRLSDRQGNTVYGDSLLVRDAGEEEVSAGQNRFTFGNIAVNGVVCRSLWTGVETEDHNVYRVQIVLPLTEVEASLRLLGLLFVIGVPIVLFISATLVYLIVVASLKPLSAMVRTANAISASNLDERVPLPANRDEVFHLASTLNTMMDRIELAFKSQKQFIADASHEIRTPLAIIRSDLEYARKQVAANETLESLESALGEVDRLKRLSDELLLLARLETSPAIVKMENVRLDELLADCVKKMKPIADAKEISLSLNLHSALGITADEDKLRSAVLNLVDNAIKYSNVRGNVDIVTRHAGKGIEISVRDRGEGIEAEEMDHIFKRFHRAASSRSRHDGSGLGLAIVRLIVGLHNGELTAESQPGKGSTFRIYLPNQKGS
jgi:two-component system, OmpR family, heavy metal sensor histidine kinase CusS